MKFNSFQRALLAFIEARYPIAWRNSDGEKIIAIGDRPLPTRDDIAARFPKQAAAIDDAIRFLIAHQCVVEVYLHGPGDFETLRLAPGQSVRAPVAVAGGGMIGYQITDDGRLAVQRFAPKKVKRWATASAAWIWTTQGAAILAAVVGILWWLWHRLTVWYRGH